MGTVAFCHVVKKTYCKFQDHLDLTRDLFESGNQYKPDDKSQDQKNSCHNKGRYKPGINFHPEKGNLVRLMKDSIFHGRLDGFVMPRRASDNIQQNQDHGKNSQYDQEETDFLFFCHNFISPPVRSFPLHGQPLPAERAFWNDQILFRSLCHLKGLPK